MSTAERSTIATELRRYLADEISLNELDEWLTLNAWDIHRRGDDAATALAHAIVYEIASVNEGLESEGEARFRLGRLVLVPPSPEARREAH